MVFLRDHKKQQHSATLKADGRHKAAFRSMKKGRFSKRSFTPTKRCMSMPFLEKLLDVKR